MAPDRDEPVALVNVDDLVVAVPGWLVVVVVAVELAQVVRAGSRPTRRSRSAAVWRRTVVRSAVRRWWTPSVTEFGSYRVQVGQGAAPGAGRLVGSRASICLTGRQRRPVGKRIC